MFLKGVRFIYKYTFFFLSACGCLVIPRSFVEKTIFVLHIVTVPLSESVYCICLGLFLGCLFSSIDIFVYSHAHTTLSWLLSLYSKSWCCCFQLCFSSSRLCQPFGVFINSESICQYLQNNFWFWLGLIKSMGFPGDSVV